MNITDVIDPTAFVSAYASMNAEMSVQSDVGMAVLDESLDTMKLQGAAMTKMMEQSVMPYLGGNVDFSV